MLREISIFTGTVDLEQALGLLHKTASGGRRQGSHRAPLAELAEYFGSETGYSQLLKLAETLGVTRADVPSLEETHNLFRDELLSARALRAHRGRNVYSAGKANLWKRWWLPFRDALTIDAATLELLRELVGLRTHERGAGVEDCVRLLANRLRAMDFSVDEIRESGHAPIVVAHRPAIGMRGSMVLYGHYDVEQPVIENWDSDPWTVTERDGRLYGVGIGDNKAALAHRLVAVADMAHTPELLWIIQGEEELGSPLARSVFPALLEKLRPTLWMEENGYFDDDGTQRMLVRIIGPKEDRSRPPDRVLADLVELLGIDVRRHGLGYRVENRSLNKNFFPAGCPFNNALPQGGRYLAIGVNDPRSGIHGANESVPMWTFPVHARQLNSSMAWCDMAASIGEEALR